MIHVGELSVQRLAGVELDGSEGDGGVLGHVGGLVLRQGQTHRDQAAQVTDVTLGVRLVSLQLGLRPRLDVARALNGDEVFPIWKIIS